MRFLPAIFANVVLLVSALGFGGLLRRLFPEDFSLLDRVALTLLGGLGIQGTILFCAGLVRFSRTSIVLVLVFGAMLSVGVLAHWRREWRGVVISSLGAPRLPALIIGAVLAVTVIGGFARPLSDMNNDAVAYHYYGPKVWLREGVIRPLPDEVLTAFPSVMETQFGALMSLGGERAPQLFSVVSLAALLLMAASLSARAGLDERGVWWVAELLAAMPALYRGAYGGYVDVVFAAFLLAAARVAFDAVRLRHYALFGIFCGISLGTKYTALISWGLLVACGFLISLAGRRRSAQGTVLTGLAASCIVAIVVASPFYLRNWVYFGCPIYPPPPGLLRFFPATRILPGVLRELEKNVVETGVGMGRSWWSFVALPFNMTYHTAEFRGAGGIGLAPLAFAAMGVVAACRRNLFAIGLVLFAFLQTVAWFMTAQASRYAVHLYVLIAIFAVFGWQYVERVDSKYTRGLAWLIVACSVGYGLYMIIPERVDDMRAAISPAFEEKRRHDELPYLASFDFLNAEPTVSKVLILSPYVAAYYSDKPYIKPLGRWGEQTLFAATDVREVLSQARALHVSHVLEVVPEDGPLKLPDKPQGLTLVFEGKDQRVYRID